MRSPLTKYGMPQVAYYPSLAALLMLLVLCLHGALSPWLMGILELVLGAVLAWLLSFFRDPRRTIINDPKVLLSPADGTIADIETVDEPTAIGGRALRIGIFLSVFNVHINRAPCTVRVENITYKTGEFKDARDPDAGKVNESNDVAMTRLRDPNDKLLVRQISGAIARRIVCATKPGDELAAGQQFGMIKFGSRTELYIPANGNFKCMVTIGDKVKSGLSILVRYE
ncbi:MAG: phosphatidylserine decarboxylase [Sedimentisphaerales bacterium]|nr:phosphatidylserine decarboxylase [Sedimentisphaerales bacterium]